MITTEQMSDLFLRRQTVDSSCSLGEIVLLKEILTTLSQSDPLHSRIVELFDREPDGSPASNQQYEDVLAQARRRMI